MPDSFDYAVIRVVPSVEREEFFNAGVILFCPRQRFLAARVHLDCRRLQVLGPWLHALDVQQRLDAVVRICEGGAAAGPIGRLSQRARFHWLIAPRSTLIQVSSAHSGICEDPGSTVERLFREQVPEAGGKASSD